LVQRVHKVYHKPDHKVPLVFKARQVFKVLMALVLQVPKAQKDRRVFKVFKVMMVLKV
jgi:hypothetical protein